MLFNSCVNNQYFWYKVLIVSRNEIDVIAIKRSFKKMLLFDNKEACKCEIGYEYDFLSFSTFLSDVK